MWRKKGELWTTKFLGRGHTLCNDCGRPKSSTISHATKISMGYQKTAEKRSREFNRSIAETGRARFEGIFGPTDFWNNIIHITTVPRTSKFLQWNDAGTGHQRLLKWLYKV